MTRAIYFQRVVINVAAAAAAFVCYWRQVVINARDETATTRSFDPTSNWSFRSLRWVHSPEQLLILTV